ncbi:MAG: serine/threonine protein kinase [Deltaproteobacteria bacterium]|nr:MAG: serine/threonine protein kinase [Deltaproteobacteria bacterium]
MRQVSEPPPPPPPRKPTGDTGVPVPVPPTVPPERGMGAVSDHTGRVLDGKYRLDALVGSGGMAHVYRATHLGLRRTVAIKLLHPRLSDDPGAAARFEREARSASRLKHPNCVQVTDFGRTEDGTLYMAMEFLEGHDLGQELGRPWPVDAAVEAMVQILRGLAHAHGQGLVHRDLKPQNVFVTTDHEGRRSYKLVDFGLAKIFSGAVTDPALTQMGLVFGTPLYMSPEQALGKDDVDARADIYAAGVIFYELLVGEPPFRAEEPVALLHQHVSQPVPPLPATVPERVRMVVTGMLAKRREERFASAQAVLDALRPRPDAPDHRPTAESSAAIAAAIVKAVATPQLTDVGGDDLAPLPPPDPLDAPAPVPALGVPAPSSTASGRIPTRPPDAPVELAYRPPVERATRPPRSRPVMLPFLLALLAATLWSARGLFGVGLWDVLPPGKAPAWLRPVHVSALLWALVGIAAVHAYRSARRA